MKLLGEALEPRQLFATLPAGFSESVVASDLARPTQFTVAPDGRIFISQQYGDLRVVANGQLQPEPVLHVDVANETERGLIGVAADPNIAQNNFIYIFYTARGANDTALNRVSRFTLNGNVVVPGSEKVLVTVHGVGIFHMSGGLAFGPDGKLYISSGDSSFKPNGQSLDTLKGKILRINPDGTIPTDNPFYNTLEGDNRLIYAYGIRNTFTIAFGRTSGRLFGNDVGNFSFEEINLIQAGGNYGWANSEGPTDEPGVIPPFYSYPGAPGGASAAVIGGALYEGVPQQFPSQYSGKYFFADHIKGWIKTLNLETKEVQDFATGLLAPVNLQLGPDGSLYYLQRGDHSLRGRLYQIKAAASEAPVVTTQPVASTVSVGRPVAFFVSASGNPTYQWQRNGVDIPGATSPTYEIPSASLDDNGAIYRARVTNSFGSATSAGAKLTVTSNQSPTAQISSPAEGTTYIGGQSITFTGSGLDPETGVLPGSSLSWFVDFHHDTHTHPFVAPTTGTSVSFTTDSTGETDPDVFYRIYLTVTDPAGLVTTTSRDVVPVKKTLTLASEPAGVPVKLDGNVTTAPVVGVVNIKRDLSAPATQTIGGVVYNFTGWSDGNTNAVRDLPFPSADTTLVARYSPAGNPGDPPPPPPGNDPDPSAPTGTVMDAERARVFGATKIRARNLYTGGGFVALDAAQDGVAFQVVAPRAGVHSLVVRYAHGESTPQTLSVSVAGSDTPPVQLSLKPTGSWYAWKTARVRVALPVGASQVQLVLQSTDGVVHLDSLRLQRTTQDAETATVLGTATVVTNPPVPDGLGLVHLRGRGARAAADPTRPVSLEFSVTAATAGDHGLHVRYANLTNAALDLQLLDVTTGATTTLTLPTTSSWSDLKFASITLPLTAGTHKLRLTSSVQSPVIIDSLTVSPPTA